MKDRWSRQESVPVLSEERASGLVRRWCPTARVEAVVPLAGGLTNANYRIDLGDPAGPVLLRRHLRAGGRPGVEVRLANFMAGRIPTPRCLHGPVADAGDGGTWSIFEWVPGRGRCLLDVVGLIGDGGWRSLGRSAGAILAGIHGVRYEDAGFLDENLDVAGPMELGSRSFRELMTRWVFEGPGRERLGRRLTGELARLVAREAERLDGDEPGACLVHGDFGPENLLVQEAGDAWRIQAVLDWEFGFSGPAMIDFGHMLRPPTGDCEPFVEGLVDGYRASGGHVPDGWRETALLLDLTAWAEFLGRAGLHPTVLDSCRSMVARILDASW